MHIIFGLIGIVLSFVMVRYREQIGDMLGEPEWAQKVGGIYNVVVVIALFFFLWSIAYMTGTLGVLFGPVVRFFSLGRSVAP